jgi:hypothetical protein
VQGQLLRPGNQSASLLSHDALTQATKRRAIAWQQPGHGGPVSACAMQVGTCRQPNGPLDLSYASPVFYINIALKAVDILLETRFTFGYPVRQPSYCSQRGNTDPQTESPSLSDCSNGLSCRWNAPKLGSY